MWFRNITGMNVALQRLDGMGGTITLADQAKKVFDITLELSTLIIRKYSDLFKDNPYIKDIIEVDYQDYKEVLAIYQPQFDLFCDIRFIVGKWYAKPGINIPVNIDDTKWAIIYENHPNHRNKECKRINDIDKYNLNQTQIVDMSLGLSYETIDIDIFTEHPYKKNIPDKYIIVNNGIDIQHSNLKQTKQWPYWATLIPSLPLPVIQVGTLADTLIGNISVDLRGKTDLLQLVYLLRRATLVICTEGGIMHLAYAAKSPKVIVLRGPSGGPINKYPGHITIDSHTCNNCWWSAPNWHSQCIKKIDNICMKSITPERVLHTVYNIIYD